MAGTLTGDEIILLCHKLRAVIDSVNNLKQMDAAVQYAMLWHKRMETELKARYHAELGKIVLGMLRDKWAELHKGT